MAISTEFNTELSLVDGTRSFTYNSGFSDYGENEWSVDGWTVFGGSDAACEHGASEAMFQMGYRWYTPEITVRPAALPSSGVTLSRRQFLFPYLRIFYNYGLNSWAAYKRDSFDKWVILNCADDRRIPHGHAWPALINAIDADDGFFTTNPSYMTGTIGSAANSFNLEITGADYDALVDRVAAQCVGSLNEYNRRNFDPQDGSNWTSDQVFTFANAVVAKVRETVPDAELNVYAYAGHRRAPSFDIPAINVQVTLGFSSGGIGYSALVDEWAVRANRVDLRGYGLIAAQDEIDPFGGGICNEDAFSNTRFNYSDYVASGCEGMNMETTGHGVPGLVGHYTLIRFMRDGATTHANVRDDMVNLLPDFTTETKELYEFWGVEDRNVITISKTYELIDALPDNNLSQLIKQYWTWYRNVEDNVEPRRKFSKDGVYYTLLEQSLRFARNLQDDGAVHGYAYSRQEANANVSGERPDLRFDAPSHWRRFGEYPPDTLYEKLKFDHNVGLQRPVELDDTILALCEVTPSYPSTDTASDFITDEDANYVFIGPGDVTTNDGTVSYGSGLHYFSAVGVVTFTGGLLFLNSFPNFRTDNGGYGGHRWLYVPKIVRGRPHVRGGNRMTIRDSRGQEDYREHIPPFSPGNKDLRKLDAGHVNLRWNLTRGTVTNVNCNPWISPQYDRALMPKALGVREGLTILSEYQGV